MGLLRDEYRFWVMGAPRSEQSDKKHLSGYKDQVRAAARRGISAPLPLAPAARVEVTIVFGHRPTRPDVDNVAKPILDALKDVVYVDDKQVVKICIATVDESVRELAGEDHRSIARAQAGEQFLINILVNHAPTIIDELRTT